MIKGMYRKPEIEIIKISCEDIIQTSGTDTGLENGGAGGSAEGGGSQIFGLRNTTTLNQINMFE